MEGKLNFVSVVISLLRYLLYKPTIKMNSMSCGLRSVLGDVGNNYMYPYTDYFSNAPTHNGPDITSAWELQITHIL